MNLTNFTIASGELLVKLAEWTLSGQLREAALHGG
jgi:hypothetical protein